ncbi:MAG: hypothetical protein K2X48_10820 [Chitinophagaceae bacterium]|nr:hypothetical protein [Chitinophagaceae bacterium]
MALPGFIALFCFLYLLRSLLMVGYDFYKYHDKAGYGSKMLTTFFKKIIQLKPILQKRLEPKGYDYKMYKRFNTKAEIYYFGLWVSLFAILFLTAKVYLNLF